MLGEELVVIKRDGRREEFIFEKLVVSILKAGADVATARKIALKVYCKVSNSTEIDTKNLTKLILMELKSINENWYKNWIVFDETVKKRKAEI